MNEEDILKNLREIEDITPQNEMYLSNLKKRLINSRQEIIQEKETITRRKNRLLDIRFIFSSLSFLSIIAIAFVIFTNSKPNFVNDLNLNQSSNTLDNKNLVLNVGNEKIIAEAYELPQMFSDFRLPNDWEFTNSDYNFAKGENPLFKSDNAYMSVFTASSSISDELDNLVYDESVLDNYSIVSTNYSENSNLSSIYENEIGKKQSEDIFEYNYIVKIGEPSIYAVFSTSKEEDFDLFESILENLNYKDPLEGWEQKSTKNFTFKLPKNWSVEEKIQSESEVNESNTFNNFNISNESIIEHDNQEYKIEDSINVSKSENSYNPESLEKFKVYGKEVYIDPNEDSEKYILKFDSDYFDVVRTTELKECDLSANGCNEIVNNYIDEVESYDHLLFIWSLNLSNNSDDEVDPRYDSEFGFSVIYPSNSNAKISRSTVVYKSLLENLNIQIKDVEVNIYALNKQNDSFVFDLSKLNSDIKWIEDQKISDIQFSDIDTVKKSGLIQVNDEILNLDNYILNYGNTTYFINIKYSKDTQNQDLIERIVDSFQIIKD